MELDVFSEGRFLNVLQYEYKFPLMSKMQHHEHLQLGQREVQQLMPEILLLSDSEHHIYEEVIDKYRLRIEYMKIHYNYILIAIVLHYKLSSD